jgi:acyl carrier protein
MRSMRTIEQVEDAIVETLGVERDEVVPVATLWDDLGADRPALLTILARVHRSTGLRVTTRRLGRHLRGAGTAWVVGEPASDDELQQLTVEDLVDVVEDLARRAAEPLAAAESVRFRASA